ncbi:type II toxin-antitoxin system prevent-host-death family antitoxin [Roseateles sp.]|uniref:type II toxin-antitoxin system prevent-host-death family antitoxin n=1 Tax=Roseateles sp. TaxID=1971397 RepID=UPI003BA99917
MRSMSARDAKNFFGKLIDVARAEPVAIEKHGRTVVVVLSIESYDLLKTGEGACPPVDSARARTAERLTQRSAMTKRAGGADEHK